MTASTGAPSSGWNASSLRSAWTATSREYPDAGHAWNRPIGAGAACAGTRPGGLTSGMAVEGEYEPSTQGWVREQVELYESSGGTEGTTLRDTGLPVVIITNRGARSGKLRKTPLMRVEHGGRYAAGAAYPPYAEYQQKTPDVSLSTCDCAGGTARTFAEPGVRISLLTSGAYG